MSESPTWKKMLCECFGTFVLVFLGSGAVHASVLLGAQSGLWQVAVVWGVAIALSIYCIDAVSGAHINPAMTIAFAVWGRHPKSLIIPYIASQLAGAFLAASLLYCLFFGFLKAKEAEKQVVRGQPESIITAMCYGEYSPAPDLAVHKDKPFDLSEYQAIQGRFASGSAFLAEFIGTMILAIVVFALTDPNNSARPGANLAPIFIGLSVSALISVIAPLTQACFNPARDFGPRVFSYFAGWGAVAFPSDMHWLTVYIVAPIAGAIVGGGIYQCVLRKN